MKHYLENTVVGRIARQRRARRGENTETGLTFIELLMAMTLLTVGLAAVLGLISVAMATNNRNKKDTTSVLLAQMVVEMVGNAPSNVNQTMTITDCASNPWTINTAAGGAPLAGSGSTTINWTSAYTDVGYSMRYVTCGVSGSTATYDVRWRIETVGAMKTIVAGARQTGGTEKQSALLYAPPVEIRTAVGQ
ncbi:MAG TPA: hypothetical protein VM056_05240 [Terriglobales bacterium]|nr:hypothetical protein [Terriglobales bacterium]